MGNRGEKWKEWHFIFLGSKITVDGDCSHEIKRRLFLRRKVMINLDSILKKQRHYFADKGLSSQSYAMVFPVVMYGCESWTIKKAEHRRIDAFGVGGLNQSWMSIESVMPSNHLILCHPLLLLPSVFPNIKVFSSESALCIRWPKDWSFSFSISPSNEYSGLISFRTDWLDLLAIQATLKSLLQHHSSKASVPWCSAFFMIQLSHPYMTTGKTIALTRQTFVGKLVSAF